MELTKRVAVLLLILASVCRAEAQAPARAAGQTWAVIVGLDYNWNRTNALHFTLSDARRFERYLKVASDHAVFLTDDPDAAPTGNVPVSELRATRANILQAVRQIAAKSGPDDTFWFYFSGHGQFLPKSESSFLIPADMRTLSSETGVSVRDLRALLADPATCRARTRILVLDACESGSSKAWKPDAGDADTVPEPYLPLEGVITFAAARPDRSALESEESPVKGGIFTYYLCCGLAGAAIASADQPVVTLDSLQRYVVANVNELCDRLHFTRQEPVFLAGSSPVAGGQAANLDPTRIVVGHYDAADVAQLKPDSAASLTKLTEKPILEPGVILVVDAEDAAVRASVESALQQALLKNKVAVYGGDLAPEFMAALRDPKRTDEALADARRLSGRLLLRVHVDASAAPSDADPTTMSVRLALRSEVTDVYGATKCAPSQTVWPKLSGSSTGAIRRTEDELIGKAIDALTAPGSDLIGALPKQRP